MRLSSGIGKARAALFLTTLLALSAACSSDDATKDILAGGGWPGIHSDARNSDTSSVVGSRDLSLAWSRPVGGPIAAYASVGNTGQMFVTYKPEGGCNVLSLEMTSRKRWCNGLGPGVVASTPIVDEAINVYVGDNGSMNSFNDHGQPRWRTPVIGTPISAQFTGDGNLLFVTHRGQVNVLSRQTGNNVTPPFDLIPPPDPLEFPNLPRALDDVDLDKCFAGTADCPVANTPAIDLDSGNFYLTFWSPGAQRASLVALRYVSGDDARIEQLWTADILAGGSASSPDLSADGSTLYVSDNEGSFYAVDAGTGETRWTYDLGFAPLGSPSTSDDGLIIPSGGRDGHLFALQDEGDHAEKVWERTDLVQRGVPAQAAGGTGYTVVARGDELVLLTFDTESGETLDEDVLPGATGFTVGTSIGPDGEVIVPTFLGEIYVFK